MFRATGSGYSDSVILYAVPAHVREDERSRSDQCMMSGYVLDTLLGAICVTAESLVERPVEASSCMLPTKWVSMLGRHQSQHTHCKCGPNDIDF